MSSHWQQTGWRDGKPVFSSRTRNRVIATVLVCKAIRDGQEVYCPCGLRWSLDEDRPECPR